MFDEGDKKVGCGIFGKKRVMEEIVLKMFVILCIVFVYWGDVL